MFTLITSNLKTTLTAIIGALAYIALHFGFEVPEAVQQGLVVIIIFLIGLFARDAK